MLDPLQIPAVDLQELLARFVLSKRHFGRHSRRVKAAAFLPPPNLELSVTRRRDASDDEIWEVGRSVAEERAKTLYGRGDALAASYHSQRLDVKADAIDGNPNHAIVVDWPVDDKAAQKLIAEEIAAVAQFLATPEK